MRFLFIGRDGRIPNGVTIPVTGNGRQGSDAKVRKIKVVKAKSGKHAEGKHK